MGAKVLITDDEEFLRELIKEMLSDFDVIEAENGEQAVELFSKHKPDVVLMDIMMPVMDGVEATKRILEMEPNANVVAVTAFSTKGEDMLKAGAKEVLLKPISLDVLIDTVEKYLPKD
ncbi:MAG: response regulator [Methermicoccaceae archaeon]